MKLLRGKGLHSADAADAATTKPKDKTAVRNTIIVPMTESMITRYAVCLTPALQFIVYGKQLVKKCCDAAGNHCVLIFSRCMMYRPDAMMMAAPT